MDYESRGRWIYVMNKSSVPPKNGVTALQAEGLKPFYLCGVQILPYSTRFFVYTEPTLDTDTNATKKMCK